MGILQKIGLTAAPNLAESDVETVRRIAEALDRLPTDHARFIGTFALLLARVANADLAISPAETGRMEELVREHGALPRAEAALAVEIAKAQHRLFGATESYIASREFRRHSTTEDRLRLLDCLFAVSAADNDVSNAEEEVVRQIAAELGLTQEEYIAARARVREHRSVLKP